LAPLADGPITDGPALLERLALSTLDDFVIPREQKFFRILMSDGIRLAKVGRISLERMGQGRERLHEIMRRLIDEGSLRDADVNVLGMAFMSPLIIWWQLHAIDADLPMIKNPRAFARQHVEQFLLGAAPVRAVRKPSTLKAAPKRRAS
jgi:hypothetical protein